MKTAILQVADTGPLESLVIMLRSVGYTCYLPSDSLKRELRDIGCDTVLDIDSLVRGMGYSRPMSLPELSDPSKVDLFVDVKAHRSYDPIVKRWPSLRDKVLWYRINGGAPEHVKGKGDEINPPCPILTPNRWYGEPGPWSDKAYSCWPPFYRFDEYQSRSASFFREPICLIHNAQGWGYGALFDNFRKPDMGIKIFGAGSPDGLINHSQVKLFLSMALAYVHLKSSDAPGYALYEALAAGCPVICTRRLIWRSHMEELFEPGVTCLVFDRETHEGLSPRDVEECTAEVKSHLDRLKDQGENRRIGNAGRERLSDIMWSERRDTGSLRDFMRRLYP